MHYIGIDPDIDKSGVALYTNDDMSLYLCNLSFFELFDFIKQSKKKHEKLMVIIEGGWLNKGNWHKSNKFSSAVNTKIGSHTGANHEVGRKIVEMCDYLSVKYKVVKPTTSKKSAAEFKAITSISYRTNQEQRDAAMLVYGL